jgi:RimJ/RimL family protein N-acetyltransferase
MGIEFEKKIVGVISLTKVDGFNGTATLGLWLSEEYWRRGIMSEAAETVIDFAFDKLKLRRIDSAAFAENKASIEFQKSLGFKEEGCSPKKSRAKSTGKIYDDVIFGLLKEDWKK